MSLVPARLGVLAVVASGLLLGACTPDFVRQDQSNVILRVVSATGDDGEQILSDVSIDGSVFNDNAAIELQVLSKDPLDSPSSFNDVTLTRYQVRYVRSDGRAVEGVDVPYPISGDMNLLIPVNGTASAVIIVVRHQAKLEPPLRNLRGGGGSLILTVQARITLYGVTTTGKEVQASTSLEVVFADFGD